MDPHCIYTKEQMTTDHKKYEILVVEDNPGDYVLVEDCLLEKIAVPNLTQAKTFGEAKKLLTDEGCTFDIILLDLSLSDMTGEDLITNLLNICGTIPVIVLTGYENFEFSIKTLGFGVADYLLKDEITPAILYKSVVYSIERQSFIDHLEHSRQEYADLFHLNPVPMWVYDLESLAFLDVNRATAEHYGYAPSEFLAMTLKDIRPQDAIAHLEQSLIENDRSFSPGIFRHQKKSGEIINVEIKRTIIRFRGKEAGLVLANDITEKQRYITAIQEQNFKLKEISWMQSHVIRAPLARLMGLFNLFKLAGNSDAENDDIMQYMKESADELDKVIMDITMASATIFDQPDNSH